MKADAGRLRAELRMVAGGASHTHRMLRSRLAFLTVGTAVLDAVGTVLMYAFEHTRPTRASTISAGRCSGSPRS